MTQKNVWDNADSVASALGAHTLGRALAFAIQSLSMASPVRRDLQSFG
jgi:hypothetical protein